MMFDDNLLESLTFEDGEIDRFLQQYRCAIHRSHLIKFPATNRRWTANCPEGGPILEHNRIAKARLEYIISDEHAAIVELKTR